MSHRIPLFALTADNQPLDQLINSRVIDLSVTDNRSGEADELRISLSDHDGLLELPRRGVLLTCKLGFTDTGLINMGRFVVDETEFAGTPDIITITARSADFRSSIKSGNRQSYHRQSLGQIAQTIASRNSLKLVITSDLSGLTIEHVDQTDESDLNLLTRLARANGAELSIKQGSLLLFKAGQAQTASGKTLPTITLTRHDGDQFRYSEADRDSDYTGVSAYYQDTGKATRKRVTAGRPEVRGGGDDPNTKTRVLKQTFASQAEAERAAKAAMNRTSRQQATFSMTTAYGRPDISSESPVRLQGFKPQIDRLNWIVAKATHSYSSSGLTSSLELEANV
jgi:phage protein D